ncbi:MAG: 4-hydroxythreonine-4-phosphate dehydrogenase PdxA [Prevotella sp.]|nr:4-hydroxythreonine-4-phosphate dehydrogenase PdxA [Prevotella sp.]MCR5152295.1 4-hydroxythreonine-4-phosphate dehydrogenase PdxA [Prevotella sp.]
MENNRIRIAITQGDTNGVGYEIIFKALGDSNLLDMFTPIIYGSPKIASYHRKALGMEANFTIINNAEEAKDGVINLIPSFDYELKVELGKPSLDSGNAAIMALRRAAEDYKKGAYDALVTAPLTSNGVFSFSGHTKYLEDRLEEEGKGMTILVGDPIRMAFVTENIPFKDVAETINKDLIKKKVTILNESLKRDFRISNPRIAVLALNPKAGSNGLVGSEEGDIIQPAVAELYEEKIKVFGPYAADIFFGNSMFLQFDAVLAMYYDQGNIPFRTICGNTEARLTTGLSLTRTTVCHDPLFTVAGKGNADEESFRKAIYLAIDVCRNREEYDIPFANPLQKQYKEKRDESEKVRFNIPKKEDEDRNN